VGRKLPPDGFYNTLISEKMDVQVCGGAGAGFRGSNGIWKKWAGGRAGGQAGGRAGGRAGRPLSVE
jgi:hypothetical protein